MTDDEERKKRRAEVQKRLDVLLDELDSDKLSGVVIVKLRCDGSACAENFGNATMAIVGALEYTKTQVLKLLVPPTDEP